MIRNLEGFRVSAHYCNQYFVCGDVVASRDVGGDSMHMVELVKTLHTGEVILNKVILFDYEIMEAWVPDIMEKV